MAPVTYPLAWWNDPVLFGCPLGSLLGPVLRRRCALAVRHRWPRPCPCALRAGRAGGLGGDLGAVRRRPRRHGDAADGRRGRGHPAARGGRARAAAGVPTKVRGYARADWVTVFWFGVTMAGMNGLFYQAIDRIPLGPAVTLEVLGPLALSVVVSRRLVNVLWAALALAGVALLMRPRRGRVRRSRPAGRGLRGRGGRDVGGVHRVQRPYSGASRRRTAWRWRWPSPRSSRCRSGWSRPAPT